MSKSPSPSPTSNIPSTKSPVAPTSLDPSSLTTSRHQTHDNSPPSQTGERVIHSQSLPSFVRSSSPPQPEPTAGPSHAGPSRIRPREEDTPEDQPMAKRIHRDVQPPVSDRSRSPSTEGGLADTEEVERSQHSEVSSAPAPAPKKKRTRTLTTPHQSAVLHALLAQSRFPTTAMREEVGRAIGLSARKVQIWFQNQRQKARRPRAQNDAPVARPPQFGPFPTVPEPEAPAGAYPRPQLPLGRLEADLRTVPEPPFDDRYSRLPPGPPYGGNPSSPRLLGPGVPGYTSSALPGSSALRERMSPEPSPVAPYSSRPHFYNRSPSPHRVPRPSTTFPPEPRLSYRDPSRTLPPLTFPPPGQRSPTAVRSAPANISPPYPYRAPASYESVVLPRVADNPPVGNIPPPFALQPQPQWDTSAFTAVPRTGPWSRPGSDRSDSTSPTAVRGLHPLREEEQSGASRRGRFDPVRSVIMPMSTSQTSPRSSRSPDHRAHEP